MRISGRRLQKKLADTRWQALGDGQLKGRQEIADFSCAHLGKLRVQLAGNRAACAALLQAQAHAEGQRLLAYFYDDFSVEEVTAFTNRFIENRLSFR